MKKTWFGIILFVSLGTMLAVSFSKFYAMQHFVEYDFAQCDPVTASCFVKICDGDPRCASHATYDNTYYVSLQEVANGSITTHYCSEETLQSFSDIVGDLSCSSQEKTVL